MAPEEFPHECCGDLPVTVHSVMLSYCHYHQAWSVHWSIVDQHQDEPVQLTRGTVNLGPFDGEGELQDAIDSAMRAVF